jgi:hypothetical protein
MGKHKTFENKMAKTQFGNIILWRFGKQKQSLFLNSVSVVYIKERKKEILIKIN